MKSFRTLVLNSNGRPLTIISWMRAIVLVYEGRMTELDFYKGHKVRDGHGKSYTIPAVIMAKKYVKRKHAVAPFNRKNVLLRYNMMCQYCGGSFKADELTYDHVIPRSKGGKTDWENIIPACLKCNNKKANKTCKEAGMNPLTMPSRPAKGETFLGISPYREKIPSEWMPFLSCLPAFKGVSYEQTQDV